MGEGFENWSVVLRRCGKHRTYRQEWRQRAGTGGGIERPPGAATTIDRYSALEDGTWCIYISYVSHLLNTTGVLQWHNPFKKNEKLTQKFCLNHQPRKFLA